MRLGHSIAGVLICLMVVLGCGGGDDGQDVPDDVAGDVPDDVAGDVVADAAGDVVADAAEDVVVDVAEDVTEQPWNYRDPWAVPVADWSDCPDTDYIGDMTLAQKAAYYDWAGVKLHQKPWDAPGHESYSAVYKIVCDSDVPATIVPDDQIPECRNTLSENTGLWSSLYVASQAFRYAATGDADALASLKRTLNGTWHMMLITGKPGLYTRDMRDPSLPSQYCVEDEEPYASAATDNEKYARYVPRGTSMVGNQFVRVDQDGCFLTWDSSLNDGAGGWFKHTDHCTEPRFAGFCWQDNVSKDEYAGHMFAAGIVAKIVDDPEVHAMAVGILKAVAEHIVANEFLITDYDGRRTRYGSAYALALDEAPGGNAVMALAWIRSAAIATGDPELMATYFDCLLQMAGTNSCIDQDLERDLPADYRTYLEAPGMDLAKGADSNYDTINIALLNWFNLVWFEPDTALREFYRQVFFDNTRGPDRDGRDLWAEANPFWNFSVVSRMDPSGFDNELVGDMIRDAVCTLKRFPTDNVRRARDSTVYPEWMVSPRHGSLAEHAIPIEERCNSVFEWWGDPNSRQTCQDDLKSAEPPAGFLLPYWMGRYFGFIASDI